MGLIFKKNRTEKRVGKKEKVLTGFDKILAYSLILIIIIGALTITFLGLYVGGGISYLWYKLIDGIIWFLFYSRYSLLAILIMFCAGFLLPRPICEYTLKNGRKKWFLVLNSPEQGDNYVFRSPFHKPIKVHSSKVKIIGSVGRFTHYFITEPVEYEDRGDYILFTANDIKAEIADLNQERIKQYEEEIKLLRRTLVNYEREHRLEKDVVVKKKLED